MERNVNEYMPKLFFVSTRPRLCVCVCVCVLCLCSCRHIFCFGVFVLCEPLTSKVASDVVCFSTFTSYKRHNNKNIMCLLSMHAIKHSFSRENTPNLLTSPPFPSLSHNRMALSGLRINPTPRIHNCPTYPRICHVPP